MRLAWCEYNGHEPGLFTRHPPQAAVSKECDQEMEREERVVSVKW